MQDISDQNKKKSAVVTDAPVRALVLYDGVCGLCDRSIQFCLKIDTRETLKFAPLQGTIGSRVMAKYFSGAEENYKSFVFIENYNQAAEAIYLRSDAALKVFRTVGGAWKYLALLCIVPRPVRDGIYHFIATRRYRWFGKFDACKIPAPEEKKRFLS